METGGRRNSSPPANGLSAAEREARRRARQRVFRRRRATLGAILLAMIATVAIALTSGSAPSAGPRNTPRPTSGTPLAAAAPPAIEAGLLSWQLPAALSREVVLPGGTTDELLLAGGLDRSGASDSGTYVLDVTSGALSKTGDLAVATHDAAAVTSAGSTVVFGGGGVAPSRTVQSIGRGGTAHVLAPLPAPRADAAAVSIGGTAYLVGGASGAALDPEVLTSRTGAALHGLGELAHPVRYPAVATLGREIYVFGGASLAGRPTDVVQRLDPVSGDSRLVARLPEPLSGASAGVLGGTIYVAGGVRASGAPSAAIYAFDPAKGAFLRAGTLPVAVGNAGSAVLDGRLYLVGGEVGGGAPSADVQVLRPNRAFGSAGAAGSGSPYLGDKLLVADRGNNRLLVLDDTGRVVWTYPSAHKGPPGGLYFPDDAFFIRHGTAIISNQEENDTLIEIAYPSGRVLFSYGHARTPGSAPGYLDNPDDAYLLRDGNIVVADPKNCRVLVLDPATKAVKDQIGSPGGCVHDPPSSLGSPNGDTPLNDGNILVSEINGSWIDEFTPKGRLVWSTQLAIGYPSDPQQIGPDRYLVADYEDPGAVVEFNRAGKILYRYQPTSGPGVLNRPSLVELLPSGTFMLNDDYNDRVVAIDPSTKAIVWQYGGTGVPGTGHGSLNTPDGFDLLGPRGATPTHPVTG